MNIPQLFDTIAPKYDKTNRLISLGIDAWWQRRTVKKVKAIGAHKVLDVACGTGSFTRQLADVGVPYIVGLDPSEGMLAVAKEKLNLYSQVSFETGYAESIPFPAQMFDAVTVSYGVRNFANRDRGFAEMERVLKPQGTLFILEFSLPQKRWTSWLLCLYLKYVLPVLGGWSTGNRAAYSYLKQSVMQFPKATELTDQLQKAGFEKVTYKRFFPGVAVLFCAQKPAN